MIGARRIPIHVPPEPGEAFDSWLLYAYPARLSVAPRDLMAVLGVEERFITQTGRLVALGHGFSRSDSFAYVSGIAPGDIDGLYQPLARYERLMKQRVKATQLQRAALPMPWSRYCPSCLSETSGRWLAAWRLPWLLVCPTHGTRMLSTCPRCHRHQRRRPVRLETIVTDTSVCSWPASGRGHNTRICRYDLRDGRTVEVADPDALAMARALTPVLDPGDPGDTVQTLAWQLADTLLIASHLAPKKGWNETGTWADAIARARILGRAWRAATDPRDETLNTMITPSGRQRSFPMPRGWGTASPALAARLIDLRKPHLTPMARLRWRLESGGQPPSAEVDATTDRLRRHLPDALWPDWTVRLLHHRGVDTTSFRIVAAAALLVPGSTLSLPRLFAGHAQKCFVQTVLHVLTCAAESPRGDVILRALTQLSHRLRIDGSPIDYDRRRRIAAETPLLRRAEWERIRASTGIAPGGTAQLKHARQWMYETLTGGCTGRRGPSPTADLNGGWVREEKHGSTRYLRFCTRLTSEAAGLLAQRATEILVNHGVIEEPLTWSPPASWVDLQGLALADPDALDPQHVGRLLREGHSIRAVATSLDTTDEHIGYTVRRHPPGVPPRKPAHWNVAETRLPPDALRRLIVEERRDVKWVAASHRVSLKSVRRLMRRHSIVRPSVVRCIDRAWLVEQYVRRRRGLADIAAELGASMWAVTTAADRYRIPRRRGALALAAKFVAPEGTPEPLASALRGQRNVERVRRFQVCARTGSIALAAALLGVSPSAILIQIAKLERACGGRLFTRCPTPPRRMDLTPLGRRLRRQADRHFGLHPSAPFRMPQPLASVVVTAGGRRRLMYLAIVARSRTLNEAARRSGLYRGNLRTSLRELERICGGPLLQGGWRNQSHRVTLLGKRVLRQANCYPTIVSANTALNRARGRLPESDEQCGAGGQ